MPNKGEPLGDLSAIASRVAVEPGTPDMSGFEPSPTRADGTTMAREEAPTEPTVEPVVEPTGEAETFQVNYNGQAVSLSLEEVTAYAQKGLDYETKMGMLKQDKEGYDSFKAWEKYLDERPDLKDFWLSLCDQYENNGGQIPRMVSSDEEGFETPTEDPKIAVLNGRIKNLEGLIEGQGVQAESQRQGQELLTRLQWAIEQRPYLKQVAERSVQLHGRDIVTERLIQRLQQNPAQDVNLLVKAVETELRETGETLVPGSGGNPTEDPTPEPFTTVEPTATPAPGSFQPPKEGTGDDLKSGKIRRGVEDYLASRNIG